MSSNTYYIEHYGKHLKTFKALQDWYIKEIAEEKSLNAGFNERHFAEAERTYIFSIIYELSPTDTTATEFKKILFEYLVKVIYKSLHTPMYPVRFPQDIYMSYLTCFDKRIDIIPTHTEQKQFLETEIERHERINKDWETHTDLTDPLNKHVYDAVEMLLFHMRMKLTNYEHTATASAHEKITARYYTDCGLPITDPSILFPEQLENRIIMECVAYKHALSDNWQSLQTDNDYFVKFIKGTLLREFKEAIIERIRPLNNFEINRIFTLSLEQFKTFKPDQREKEFIKKYSDAYWHPNYMDKVIESEAHTAKYLIAVLSKYYSLFIKATEQAFLNYQSDLNGLGHIQPITADKLPSKILTPMQQDFTLQKRITSEPVSFQNLLDEAFENDLIEYFDSDIQPHLFKEYKENFKNWLAKKVKQSGISSELFRMYCVYANFEQFLTEINQPDYDNSPAYTIYDFRPFDRVFDDAIHFGIITVENPGHRAASYSLYDFLFTSWLREKFNFNTEDEYRRLCTLKNFKQFYKEKKQQEDLERANFEKEKLQHQIDAGLIDRSENVEIPSPDISITKTKKNEAVMSHKSSNLEINPDVNKEPDFDSLFNPDTAALIMDLLSNFNIYNNGVTSVNRKNSGIIRGIAEALIALSLLPEGTLMLSFKVISAKIKSPVLKLPESSPTCAKYITLTKQYVKDKKVNSQSI